MRLRTRKRLYRQPPSRREGMVLLIVLLILMMTTATATFAVHSTGYEIQAAGSMRQALRTRNISEGMANAFAISVRGSACDIGTAAQDAASAFSIKVEKYGYPNTASAASHEILRRLDITDIANDLRFENTPIPDDSALATSSVAATYQPAAQAIVECVTNNLPDEEGEDTSSENPPKKNYRMRMTVFGEMLPQADSNTTDSLRSDHETISVSRVYMNL